MVHKKFLFGLAAAFALALVTVVAGCDTGSTDNNDTQQDPNTEGGNNLVGSWTKSIDNVPVTFTFTEADTWTLSEGELSVGEMSGTYNLSGTVTASVGGATAPKAAENAIVTLTVEPDAGYQYAAGSLRVTRPAGSTVPVTPSGGGTYTFTMPADTVTVTATFERPLTSVAAVTAYLGSVSGGTQYTPVFLPVKLNLADMTNVWTSLLSEIQTANKYVALDLSVCTMTGTEFDTGTASTGKNKIVSLVLPNAAKSIKGPTANYPSAFQYFFSLTSVSGSHITTIGARASYGREKLASADFPAATDIGEVAFSDCWRLVTVNLPAAVTIGEHAFYYCDKLQTLNLPVATEIGNKAFQSTGGTPLTITLGSQAPTLGIQMFYDLEWNKSVTVRVPSGATGYGPLSATYTDTDATENWGNGFRGMGWDGSAFISSDTSDINSTYITLTIQAIGE
jgi:hypothetical protein